MAERKLFGNLPGRVGQVEIDANGNQVKASSPAQPSADFKVYTPKQGRGNSRMNKPNNAASGIATGIATAVGRYATDPEFRQNVNQTFSSVSKVIKPAKSNVGNINGYLSEAPNPAETALQTGIRLTVLEKNYTKAEENVCSPMHTTHVLFTFPSNSADIVYDWYMKINTRDYQTRVQENVNWAVDITTKFSATNIITAMNALFKALQYYFFYRSIDAYCRPGMNQNDAMYAIQSEFDFNTRLKIQEIARLLARTPLPPKMLEFCRYINTNYLSGETPNSPIIKIVPFPATSGTVMCSNANLDAIIALLDNDTNKDVWNTLGRVNKSWVPGTPDKIFDPPMEPKYDRDFITIFNNLPSFNGLTSTSNVSPTVATNTTNFTYLSWNNNLDGIAIAFADGWDATNGKTYNGMVLPQATGSGSAKSNRFSYYKVSGTLGWYNSRLYQFLKDSRLDTYISDGTTITVAHRFGSDMVINVSPLMISTTVINAIDYLLSSSMIKADVQNDNRTGGNRGRRFKGKLNNK